MRIGVLALQGAFVEHEQILNKLGIECIEIKKKEDLAQLDGLILPGGESTVQGQLLKKLNLFEPIYNLIQSGLPTLATCAGLILLAEKIEGNNIHHLGTLPITVKRNAYGRQLGSFCENLPIEGIGEYPMIFIRAPYITDVNPDVQILAKENGHIIAVKYKNQIGLAFHPELSGDIRIHEYFIKCVTSILKRVE